MADKIIFPIGFDLNEGVEEAGKAWNDKYAERLEKAMANRSVKVKIDLDVDRIEQSMKSLIQSVANLNTQLQSIGVETRAVQQQVATGAEEQNRAIANTTNTISHQLVAQERVNKAMRDTYDEQSKVKQLLEQYHDTYESQIQSLAKLNAQLESNRKAQADNKKAFQDLSITQEEYYKKQLELLSQQRQLTQEKRALTQIMNAEEKALLSQEGSYARLSQELSLLKRAYKELGEEGRTSPFGKELEMVIQNLDTHLKNLAADMGEFQRNVGNYAIAGQNGVVSSESLAEAIGREARTMQDLIDQTRILEEAKKLLAKDDENYESTINSINAKLEENKRKLADVSDIINKQAKTVAEAEAQNKRLQEALKQVDVTSAEAQERIKQLNDKIRENTRVIKENTPAIEEQKRANASVADAMLKMVGINLNFGKSFQSLGQAGATGIVQGLTTKVKALGTTLKGLLANPVMLSFLGLAGVTTAFKWWYDYNKGLIEASKLTKNFTGFVGDTADKVTADMQALADSLGRGFDETIRAANTLVQQFNISWSEATDLIQQGIVAGANMYGNMLENIRQYGPALRDAGVSAKEFIAILANTRNGIFNERGIQDIMRGGTRLRAMTKQIAASLDAIGISSKKMQKELADGTINMFQAVQQVSKRLQEIPENAQAAGNVMKQVFGRTAAEGGVLLIQSIADVNTNLGEMIDKMGEMGRLNNEYMNAQRELNETLNAVFKMSGTTFAEITTQAKIFLTQALVEIIKGLADIANWFVRIYNESIVFRYVVNSMAMGVVNLWDVAKFVLKRLYNSFKSLGEILEGVFTLDWNKVKQAWANGMQSLVNDAKNLGKNIAQNAADAFKRTLNDELKEIKVELGANIPDADNKTNNKDLLFNDKSIADTINDTRIQILNEIEKTLSTIYKKYDEIRKRESNTKALEHINEIYKEQLTYLNQLGKRFNLAFDMPTSFTSLQEYRKQILDVVKGIKGADKAAVELSMTIGTAQWDMLGKNIEKELKQLEQRISQTKTAKEFFDKILNLTGDAEIATSLTISVYGDAGQNTTEQMKNYLSELFGEYEVDIPIIVGTDMIDWSQVRKNAEEALAAEKIGAEQYDKIIKAVTDGEKTLASVGQEFAKLVMNYDEIAQQRVNIENKYAEDIKKIDDGLALYRKNATEEEIKQMEERAQAAKNAALAERDLGLLKLSSPYMRFFSAINTLTLKEASDLRSKLRLALFQAFQQGKISANELRKELKACDEQFNKLVNDAGYFRTYLEGGFDGLINKVRESADEVTALAAEIAKMKNPDEITEGQKSFLDKVLGKFGTDKTGKSFADLFKNANGDTAQMAENLMECGEGMEGMASGGAGTLAIIDTIIKNIDATIRGIAQVRDQLNAMRSDTNQLKGGLWDAFEYLENFNQYAASGWQNLKNGNIAGAIADTISSIISIFQTAQNQKVRRLNEEIKQQQKIVDGLSYSYQRLEKAMEKAFGGAYISNYNQRLDNLRRQQEAYRKQYEAEQSKGKKADEDKMQDYLDSARDVADEIADMRDELVEWLAGTDITSAARDFAQSWIDAYVSFEDTTEAIRQKFADMIQNMIIEALAARLMENLLQPVYGAIDKATQDGMVTEREIANISELAFGTIDQVNESMELLMQSLKQAGLDVQKTLGDTEDFEYTGIARDIATASEESINGLAAGINTQNFYISQIHSDVAIIRQYLAGDPTLSAVEGVSVTDLVTMQNTYLQHLPAIAQNTALTAERCERAAMACENIAERLRRVTTTNGNKQALAITMN